MTTPERLKRRQLIEGACLILVGVLMVVQGFYFHHVDRGQSACVQRNFTALSRALDARSGTAERESEQNRALWGVYAEAAGIIQESGKPADEALSKADQARLNKELVSKLVEYQRVMKGLERERREHPLPPYPPGTCEGGE